ncbi:MAG: hypothetical protein ACRES7_10975 [Gammaproteobacteria bacterium]
MGKDANSQADDVREVLIDVVEIELAALKAAAVFWQEWIEQTSSYVTAASKSLEAIRSRDQDAGQVLLELADANREAMRRMTELPRKIAERYISELGGSKPGKPARAKPAKRRARAKP